MGKKIKMITTYKTVGYKIGISNFYRRVKIFGLEKTKEMKNEYVYTKIKNIDEIKDKVINGFRDRYSHKEIQYFISVILGKNNKSIIKKIIKNLIQDGIMYEEDKYYIIKR